MLFRRRKLSGIDLTTDIHSHILPCIDDGSQSMEESLALLRGLVGLGLKTVWLTPHVHENRFPNTYETVLAAFEKFDETVRRESIEVELKFAAEYYMGPRFMRSLESGERLLTIKDKYLLVEFSMTQEPLFVFETLFAIAEKGYTPILAHPERYGYFYGRKDIYARLKKHGCLLQMNLLSPAGFYGKRVKAAAEEMLKEGLYDLAGTDIHNMKYLERLADKEVARVLERYDFKNDRLS
jgi:tyrosine-protein phosphatase YwqE